MGERGGGWVEKKEPCSYMHPAYFTVLLNILVLDTLFVYIKSNEKSFQPVRYYSQRWVKRHINIK